MTMSTETVAQWRGMDVLDPSGDKVGKIDEIYLDQETDQPEWALVHTGLFGTKRTFVPIGDATERDGTLVVPYGKGTVKDAPDIEANGQLSKAEEAELHRHYGQERP